MSFKRQNFKKICQREKYFTGTLNNDITNTPEKIYFKLYHYQISSGNLNKKLKLGPNVKRAQKKILKNGNEECV